MSQTSKMPNGGGSGSLRASDAAVATTMDVAQRLGVDWTVGLTSTEAEQRRQLHGLNEFNIKEEDPLWKKYLNQVS